MIILLLLLLLLAALYLRSLYWLVVYRDICYLIFFGIVNLLICVVIFGEMLASRTRMSMQRRRR